MLPIVLVLETSTPRALVALGLRDGRILTREPEIARQHACAMVPEIDSLLTSANLRLEQLDAIAVGLGPGSFTGLRVGLTVAKTLAYTTGVRLVGLPSLDLIAGNLDRPGKRAVVATDAQRGEWYVARPSGVGPISEWPGVPVDITIEPAQRVMETLGANDVLLGPSIARLRERGGLPADLAVLEPADDFPRAEPTIRQARAALAVGISHSPMSLEPIYVRKSAAEEKADLAAVPASTAGMNQ